jgi:hypothetical protein
VGPGCPGPNGLAAIYERAKERRRADDLEGCTRDQLVLTTLAQNQIVLGCHRWAVTAGLPPLYFAPPFTSAVVGGPRRSPATHILSLPAPEQR